MIEEIIKDDGVYGKFPGGINKYLGRGYSLPAGEDRQVSMWPLTIPLPDGSNGFAVQFMNKDKPTKMYLSEAAIRAIVMIYSELKADEYEEKKKNDPPEINQS